MSVFTEQARRLVPIPMPARELYDAWVAAGRPKAPPRPKPLRLRLELDSHGPAWLSLLALCGYLVGVVPAELITDESTWQSKPRTKLRAQASPPLLEYS